MAVIHDQLQMYAEVTGGVRAGLPRHAPAAVTDDTQVLGRCLPAARVVSSLVSTGGGFGRRPFPFRSQHVPLPHRAVWAGRMRALHGAALRSRFILIPQREIPAADLEHQVRANVSDALPCHLKSRLSSWVRPDVDQPSERIPQGAEQISQGHGNV